MAQGANKLKSNSRGIKKEKHKAKVHQMRKGPRFIAPKKAKHLEAEKLRMGLEKAIKANIENEITSKVKAVEAKSFHVVTAPKVSKKEDTKSKDSKRCANIKKK